MRAEDFQVERGRQDKEMRQRALMEAAIAVFAEHGFDAATTRSIAERAGCAEGLIHRYFEGKEGLLRAALHHKASEPDSSFSSLGEPADSVEGEVEQFLLLQIESMWARQDFMRVCVSRAVIDAETGRFLGGIINEHRVAALAARLRRYQERGQLRADVDVQDVASALTGAGFALGFMAQIVFAMDREEVRRIARSFAAVVGRGLQAGGDARPVS